MTKTYPIFCRILFYLVLIASLNVQAAFLRNVPVKVVQPDGRQLNCFITGDEYYNRLHDANNFTILKNSETGYYVYATRIGDNLVPTTYIVGLVDPATTGLQPGMDFPAVKWKESRAAFWSNTPSKPRIKGLSEPNQKSAGTFNNIVVFIRFSDQAEFTTPLSTYDGMFNNNTSGANSMYNYYKEVSYNTLFIQSSYYPLPNNTVVVSYVDSHERNYYVPYDVTTNPIGYTSSQRTSREHTLLANAVQAIASQVPSNLNLDYNNDGYVDNVCFIIRGTTTAWSTLLWPHRWSLYSTTVMINNKRVWDYNFQLDDFLTGSGVGVLCHEMFHSLGAPDLYHYTDNGIDPIGAWDIMDNTANPPQHMGAYMKYKYGNWISNIPAITTGGTYTLNPQTSSTNNCYKITTTKSPTEYFVLEYRKKTGTFENSVPGSGLVIYRINPAAGSGNANGPPDELYIYRPNGDNTTEGSISQGFFTSDAGRTVFNNGSNPADFLSNDTLAGLNISNVTAAGNSISFTVNFNIAAFFTASVVTTCPNQTIIFSDLSTGGPTSWAWSFSPNTVTYVDGTGPASQNPHVKFNNSGDYDVSLSVTGSTGTNVLTNAAYIHILLPQTLPFADNFESGSFNTNHWTILNPDLSTTWTMNTQAAGNGASAKCAYIDFYDYSSYLETDDLVTPSLDLTGFASAQLSFKVSYRQYSSDYHDSLKVNVYGNCGATYLGTIYSKGDTLLATGYPTTNSFVPAVSADWRTETIDLSAYIGTAIVIHFQGINGYGNNLYIDDVSINGSFNSVQGTVTYFNSVSTPMSNTTVTLKSGTTVIATANTNTSGYYHIDNLPNGTYTVQGSTNKTWGGVNSTDALLAMKHFVNISPLTGLKLKAGDVDGNTVVNAVDALSIQKRSVGSISSFPVGNWVSDKPGFTLTGGSTAVQNFTMLCTGDVNASYNPPLVKQAPGVFSTELGNTFIKDNLLEIPVYLADYKELGAISLGLEFPADAYSLDKIVMPAGQNDYFTYDVTLNLVNISWFDTKGLNLENAEPLFILYFIKKEPRNPAFKLDIAENSEFADKEAIPYQSTTLLIPAVKFDDQDGEFRTSTYPNPFTGYTTIWFSLKEQELVDVTIYSSDGKEVTKLQSSLMQAGFHQLQWDGKNKNGRAVPAGIYQYRVKAGNQMSDQKIIYLGSQ